MQRAVSIAVTCIDKDYGFTHVSVMDNFSGKKLGYISISHEIVYGLDPGTDTDIIHIGVHSDNSENVKINNMQGH